MALSRKGWHRAPVQQLGVGLRVMWRVMVLMVWAVLTGAGASGASGPGQIVTIDRAVLQTAGAPVPVDLPHVVELEGLAGAALVRLVLEVPLTALPDRPLGIYVSKMSLSGRLFLNGRDIGSCEPGPLETLRCLHRPYLFVPPPHLWQVGVNRLEVELYATSRQMNGLSPVLVGPAERLYRSPYIGQRFLRVGLVEVLTWLSVSLGFLSLMVYTRLRSEPVWAWFGAMSIVNALSNVNALVTVPLIGIETFNWFVFASRVMSVCLLFAMMLSAFDKLRPWLRRVLMGYMVFLPVLIWFSGSDRDLVFWLYFPLILFGVTLVFLLIWWTLRNRRRFAVGASLTYGLLTVAGVTDWLRLGGKTPFEGFYFSAYALTGVALVFGMLLVNRLAAVVVSERALALRLETEVARRTRDLETANRQLAELSLTDPLTGIANRRHFDTTLRRECALVTRHGVPLALMLIDVDFFKNYNDRYGHQAGDVCLRQVAATLRGTLQRGTDDLARYGGEEFAVITHLPADRALRLAEDIRAAVADLGLPNGASRFGRITVCVGLAVAEPGTPCDHEDLVRRADSALYRAKALGRNRVIAAPAAQPRDPASDPGPDPGGA